MTQRSAGKAAGMKQPVIAWIESGDANPAIETILKVLASMKKTLKVVNLE